MADPFRIPISLDDQTGKGAAAIFRRMEELANRLKGVGDQANKLGKSKGLPQFGHQLRDTAAFAEKLAGGLSGAGDAIGVLTGAGSIAGLASLAGHVATFNRHLTITSAATGVSTDTLQKFQGAARLAGFGAETMNQALGGIGQTMEDAAFGRNPQALAMFSQLGLSMRHTKSGAMDSADMLNQLLTVFPRINVQAANTLASTLGIPAQLVPLLRQGQGAFKGYVQQVQALHAVMTPEMQKTAADYTTALQRMDIAAQGLGQHLGTDVMPVLTELADWSTNAMSWFSKIDEDLHGWAGRLLLVAAGAKTASSALSLLRRFRGARGASGAAAAEGGGAAAGGEAAAETAGGGLMARLFGSSVARWAGPAGAFLAEMWPSTANRGETARLAGYKKMPAIVDYFMKHGWSRADALGIAGGLFDESGFSPTAVGDNGQAYGLGQWHPDRLADLDKFAGHDIRIDSPAKQLREQLAFINYDLTQGKEKAAGDALRLATTPWAAGYAYRKHYERPADLENASMHSGSMADQFSAVLGGAAAPPPAGPPQPQRLDIHVHGLPAGSQATAAPSPGAPYSQLTVHYAMPTSRFP